MGEFTPTLALTLRGRGLSLSYLHNNCLWPSVPGMGMKMGERPHPNPLPEGEGMGIHSHPNPPPESRGGDCPWAIFITIVYSVPGMTG